MEKKEFDAEKYYAEVNKKLKNRTFLDIDEQTQRRLNQAALKNWRRKVNDVDMAYADALALGGYEFFRDYCTGAIPAEFAVSIVKALRKREAQHEAKIIQAVLNGCASVRAKKPYPIIRKTDKALNEEAYGD